MTDGSNQRRSERSAVALGARCRTETGSREFVALVDLTAEGCRIFTRRPGLVVGQRVVLQPETLSSLNARVQWTRGFLAGLRFENPLYGPVFEHLARMFARPGDESLPDGLQPSAALPRALRFELLRKIELAEAKYLAPADGRRDPYKRLPDAGPRTGLAPQKTERKLIELFLG